MTPDDTVPPPSMPTFAVPRRAVPLKTKPVAPVQERATVEARLQGDLVIQTEVSGQLERKLAGLHDAQDLLRVLNTELLLQRTARLHGTGGKSRQAMRVLSITVLFALLIAALAAMSWMQSRLAQQGISRHRIEAKTPN